MSGEAQPENFERRQRELTAQVAELASLARGAESAEAERRKDSVLQLARQKALVRETKGINLEQLSREVDELRNRRLALEKELGFKEGESEEYELY